MTFPVRAGEVIAVAARNIMPTMIQMKNS